MAFNDALMPSMRKAKPAGGTPSEGLPGVPTRAFRQWVEKEGVRAWVEKVCKRVSKGAG